MPAIFPPGPHGVAQTNAPHLVHADSGTTVGATGEGVRTADAIRGWHDLNMAVARSLPSSLLRAGQLHRATLSTLRHKARVR